MFCYVNNVRDIFVFVENALKQMRVYLTISVCSKTNNTKLRHIFVLH